LESFLRLAPGADRARLTERKALVMVAFAEAKRFFRPRRMWRRCSISRRMGGRIASTRRSPERRGAMMRGLAWLCKLDLIRISASESAATDR
jgi:hypothetical protein